MPYHARGLFVRDSLPTAPSLLVQDGDRFLAFARPQALLAAREPHQVLSLLEQADAELERGRFIAGYLAYEAAAAFGLPTLEPDPDGPPLAWLGVFDRPSVVTLPRPERGRPPRSEWVASIDAERYAEVVARLHQRIAAGDSYQLNFAFPLAGTLVEEPFDLFLRLVAAQRPRHAAYVEMGRHAIVSASPELFFRRDGDRISARPMKGTGPRGRTVEEDERCATALHESEKDRAENIMIVDMLRNDLGRVAETGSVEAGPLFEVERYPTLLQMTSRVSARSRAPLSRLLASLFPCASVTGAPKLRTMEILTRHETGPRGVYTGTIGWAAPNGDACWNVAIRTAVADRERRALVFGVGSGIVADSRAAAEYAECMLKARVLEEPAFALLETLAFVPEEGFRNLAGHLLRLQCSAHHFQFRFDGREIERLLRALALDRATRVRLLLDSNGQLTVETKPLLPDEGPPTRLGLAAGPVDPASVWLYHKTTQRETYDAARASRADCDDVLLWNDRGELTESSVANVIVEIDGRRVTPPVSCGLLPGIERGRLLAGAEVEERVLPVSALRPGSRLWLVSSLRGTREAVFVS